MTDQTQDSRTAFQAWTEAQGYAAESDELIYPLDLMWKAWRSALEWRASAGVDASVDTPEFRQSLNKAYSALRTADNTGYNYDIGEWGRAEKAMIACINAWGAQQREAGARDKNGNHVDDLSAWLDEAKEEIEVQGVAFHACSLKLKQAEDQLAAVASNEGTPERMSPAMVKAVQLHSEMGAYIASNWAGAYGCFDEFWRVAMEAHRKEQQKAGTSGLPG